MAKKKNKQVIRPWCWYCEREFEDEKVLMQHQKAKHFKCNMCPRRLNTAGGLAVHIQQVHKLEPENLPRIENAIPGRDGYEVEIFGMEGIPAPDVADYKRRKEIELGLAAGSISQPPPKRQRTEKRALTEDELKAALEAHKALMGGNSNDSAGQSPNTGVVFGAPPQAYSAAPVPAISPPVPMPGMMPPVMPPFIPGQPPPGMMPGFPPMPGMPGFPPGPGFPMHPGFPPPGMFPPGQLPGVPPSPPAMSTFHPPPTFVPASGSPFPPPMSPPVPASAPGGAISDSSRSDKPTLPDPKLEQTNPPFKKETDLKYKDANFSPEELRAYHPKYKPSVAAESSNEESRGKKRARAEDFL